MSSPVTVVKTRKTNAEPTGQSNRAVKLPTVESKSKDAQPTLTIDERKQLEGCETLIDSFFASEFVVGESLRVIDEEKLYREVGTFEKYCEDRWDMSPQHAYRLINAAKFMSLVKKCNQIGEKDRPKRESHIRRLIDGFTKEDERLKAWQRVIKKAEGERVTGKLVQEVVDEMKGNNTRTVKARVAKPHKASTNDLDIAISDIDKALKKAEGDDQQKAMIKVLTRVKSKIESYLKSLKS